MTADEIRSHWRVQGKYPPELVGDFALVEIAAQLAELNENLAVFRDVQSSSGHGLCVAPESF